MKKFMLAVSLVFLLGIISFPASAYNENIAKGCPVSVSPEFSYWATGNKTASLTDGVYSKGRMWAQKAAVGWEPAEISNITVDLGSVQPVSGVSFSTASGDDAVQWPGSIMIWTSNDSKNWYYAGELISLSEKNGLPKMEKYANHRYYTYDLKTHGRYVRFAAITSNEYTFCDEVEVYKGTDNLLNQPLKGDAVKDTDARIHEMYFSTRIIYRLKHDSDAVRKAILASKISKSQKNNLCSRLDKLNAQIDNVNEPNTDKFEAVLPINSLDAKIFAVYGSLLKAKGLPQISAWKKNNYDFLTLTEVPKKLPASAKLSVTMMKNEHRADSVLLTNASENPLDLSIKVSGIPGAPKPNWLTISQVAWTDTTTGTPIAAAMPPAEYANGVYKVKIPAGITSKIWITVDSNKLASGKYKGSLKVTASSSKLSIPLNVYVSTVKMGRPRLSLGVWDYCVAKKGDYAVTETTYDAALETMRTHYVDSPWGHSADLPWPTADNFDSNGNIVKPLNFTALDTWVSNWPQARNYLVYLSAPTNFCGAEMGTAEFNARLTNWMKALADHMISLGLKPSQLGLMIRDEPDVDSQKVVVQWAKVMKAAKTGILLYQDLNISKPHENEHMVKALNLVDISIPMLGTYYAGGPEVRAFFEGLQKTGHKIWFYECEGQTHLLDPYRYYRLESWYSFKHDAKGIGLWAFADTRPYKSSWNEYTWPGNPYSPLFFRPTDITTGIHWEGVREGIEDNEYLSMLKDAAATTSNASLKLQAKKLLKEAVNAVVGKFDSATPRWNKNPDSSKADIYRLKVLRMLEKMKAANTIK